MQTLAGNKVIKNELILPFEYLFEGPTALPFLGNLLQLGTQPHRVLWKWKQEYGPVYSVKMGSEE